MINNLRDISTKIDALTVSLFRDFIPVVGEIPWLMVGATARDVFLHYIHEIPIRRATKDIDLGVQLRSWDAYEELKSRLLQSKKFAPSTSKHRLIHNAGLPLDIIPFGGLADSKQHIRWPSGFSSEMNVTGYEDVLRSAEWVKIGSNPDIIIPIAAPSGLALLKILAWNDNPSARVKDVIDLAHILNDYLDLGNWARLEGEDADLTESMNFNVRSAGAEMLGRDLTKISAPETLRAINAILNKELSLMEVSTMVREMSYALTMSSPTECMELLRSFVRGTSWTPPGRK